MSSFTFYNVSFPKYSVIAIIQVQLVAWALSKTRRANPWVFSAVLLPATEFFACWLRLLDLQRHFALANLSYQPRALFTLVAVRLAARQRSGCSQWCEYLIFGVFRFKQELHQVALEKQQQFAWTFDETSAWFDHKGESCRLRGLTICCMVYQSLFA